MNIIASYITVSQVRHLEICTHLDSDYLMVPGGFMYLILDLCIKDVAVTFLMKASDAEATGCRIWRE